MKQRVYITNNVKLLSVKRCGNCKRHKKCPKWTIYGCCPTQAMFKKT